MKLTELFNALKIQNYRRSTNGASAIFEGTKSYSQHALNDMVEDHLPENTRVWKIQWVMSEDGNDNYRPQFIFAKTKDEAAHKFTERMKHPSLGLVAIESIKEIPFNSLNEGEVIQFPNKKKRDSKAGLPKKMQDMLDYIESHPDEPEMSDREKYDAAIMRQKVQHGMDPSDQNIPSGTDFAMEADPTKEEMQHVITKWLSGSDIDELYHEAAMYWFASDFHSGQSSNLYSALSMSQYNPGPMTNKIENENEVTQELYYTLYDYFSNLNESEHPWTQHHGKRNAEMDEDTWNFLLDNIGDIKEQYDNGVSSKQLAMDYEVRERDIEELQNSDQWYAGEEYEVEEGKQLKNRKQPKDAAGAWNKAEKYTKYDPPKTKNKGVSARAGFVGG